MLIEVKIEDSTLRLWVSIACIYRIADFGAAYEAICQSILLIMELGYIKLPKSHRK